MHVLRTYIVESTYIVGHCSDLRFHDIDHLGLGDRDRQPWELAIVTPKGNNCLSELVYLIALNVEFCQCSLQAGHTTYNVHADAREFSAPPQPQVPTMSTSPLTSVLLMFTLSTSYAFKSISYYCR